MPAEVMRGLAQAHRMTTSYGSAARACQEGRRAHPDHPGLLVEDARISLYHYRRAGEDEQHAWKRRLLDAEQRLRAHEAAGKSTGEAELVLAELSLGLGRWQDAADRWAAIEVRHPQRAASACMKQAEAQRRAGDLRAAREALERVPAGERGQARFVAELDRLTTSLSRWSSNELGRHARLRYRLGDVDAAIEQVQSALALRGYGVDRMRHAASALGPIAALLHEATDAPRTSSSGSAVPPREDEPVASSSAARSGGPGAGASTTPGPGRAPTGGSGPLAVHVSGLLYSGSGAVFDHLRCHPDVHTPFATREAGFLKKRDNIAELCAPERRDGETFPIAVADAILASVFGLGQSGRPLLELVGVEHEAPLLTLCRRLTVELHREWSHARARGEPVSASGVNEALGGFLDALVELVAPVDTGAVLLNNAILPDQLGLVELFSNARAIAVLRDPRDQYVSQRLEFAFPMDCDSFVETMRDRAERLAELLAAGRLADRVRCVWFEEYVTDASLRRDVLSWLGLDPRARELDSDPFDPARSQANIGIHRDYEEQAEIARVRAGLADVYEALAR